MEKTNTKLLFILVLFFCSACTSAQKPNDFWVAKEQKNSKSKYVFINTQGQIVMQLDSDQYEKCYTDTMMHFAIVKFKHKKGFWAIDKNKKIIFEVYDKNGDATLPDALNCKMIRITDGSKKIGFANDRGQIIVKPIYDYATDFYQDKAVIGNKCEVKIVGCAEPSHPGGDSNIYDLVCKNYGYLDINGKLHLWGKYSQNDLESKIWME